MHKTISKNSGALDLDYETMRLDALALLQKLSGNLWTDFNTHDPGVTLLEGIVFALSELGYKTGFDIEDYLTDKTGKIDLSREALYTKEQVMECFPVTAEDYSNFFTIHLKNAIRVEFLNCIDGKYQVVIEAREHHRQDLLHSFNELWNEWRLLGENVSSVNFLRHDERAESENEIVTSANSLASPIAGTRRELLDFSPIAEQFPAVYRKGEGAVALQKFLNPVEYLIEKFLKAMDDFSDLFSVDSLKTTRKKYNRILDQMLAMYGVEFPEELFLKIHERQGALAFVELLRAKVKYVRFLPALHMRRCGKYFKKRLEMMLGITVHIVDGIFLGNCFGKVYVALGNAESYSEETRQSIEDFIREEVPAHLIPVFIWFPETLPSQASAFRLLQNEHH